MEEAISSSERSRHVGGLGGEVEAIEQAEEQTMNGAWQWEKVYAIFVTTRRTTELGHLSDRMIWQHQSLHFPKLSSGVLACLGDKNFAKTEQSTVSRACPQYQNSNSIMAVAEERNCTAYPFRDQTKAQTIFDTSTFTVNL